jgi:hypothetical protein
MIVTMMTNNTLLSLTLLIQGGLEWDDKLYIAADIARGLHFLHEV